MPDNYILIGILRKPHGLNGAFNFTLYRELKSLKKYPPHFFLKIKGGYIPYFTSQFDLKDIYNGYIGFEEVTRPEQAKALANIELYIDEKKAAVFFKKAVDEYGYLIGYTAYDKEKELGKITGIHTLPAQILAEIDVNGREVLVPIVDALVIELNKPKRVIIFDMPEGLY